MDLMIRVYDSGVVLREDIIERVRQYYAEIEQLQKEIDDSEVKLYLFRIGQNSYSI